MSLPSQCTYRCVVLPDGHTPTARHFVISLNAPTGAWCSLTAVIAAIQLIKNGQSQCTYRCVVLPDEES